MTQLQLLKKTILEEWSKDKTQLFHEIKKYF